ncbi:MAG: hypothetical protein ACTS73_03310 [Arsenophonus sp. NEOnobi-MAG3]
MMPLIKPLMFYWEGFQQSVVFCSDKKAGNDRKELIIFYDFP